MGSSSGMPTLGKTHAAVLVELMDRTILLDCGEGTSVKFLQHEIDKDQVDAIYISHYHPDHVAGIFLLIQLFYLQKRTKPLKIYLPERVEDFRNILSMFYTFSERMSFSFEFYLIETKEEMGITPIPSDHLEDYKPIIEANGYANQLQSYSFLLEEGDKRVIYSSDLKTLKNLSSYLEDFTLLIIEGIHVSFNEIKKMLDKTSGRIIITHSSSWELENLNSMKNVEYADEEKLYYI